MLKTVGFPSTRTGDQTIVDGNLVIGTAGKGIDFSAAAHAAGMTSELLDDYEEGSWTPALEAGAGAFATLTYTTQSGRYIKVGGLVWLSFEITINAFSIGTASSHINLVGFPFARPALEDQYGGGVVTQYAGWTTAAPTVLPRSSVASSILRYPSSATTVSNVPPSHLAAGCSMNGFIIIATA